MTEPDKLTLFTNLLPFFTNDSICCLILLTFSNLTSSCMASLSVALPLGSPTSPVAPPTSVKALWPRMLKCNSNIKGSKLPKCKDLAEGSAPQYNPNLAPFSRISLRSDSAVLLAIKPRSLSRDNRSLVFNSVWKC
ncbi:hypothetical protein WICPIJ_005243 [Wickerhamomyces pijperi]|uniref:Uncharacterized protein n=1 Tax=Wickerhamomyces pijperi TaxID=599730 RepID=A0A9P8Q650_WICPI|nr:hypothetical protein WICPIJ_005243 [Wickerhamomyces pijperi]